MSLAKKIISVEASDFRYSIGDQVHQGEIIGIFQGRPVLAPFHSIIESVSFDSEEHVLTIVLAEAAAES